ncbi:HpsJ-like protein, cyanoexosortase A-associated [Synechocystis sp. CACIAM 05]|uniref:HpsJ-like protein, cyanoexosortase A-associated n=1 Tax=Synechocystis sp. CACIAM 05 TaxID=1933929 RepID=UPI00138E7CC5|nr:HpsJ family protein [Synechocystis sp. CACIAM 05]QHU99112.1 hypothetical protein BWK47_02555 [Synechocystis sp. CACIAM 05]
MPKLVNLIDKPRKLIKEFFTSIQSLFWKVKINDSSYQYEFLSRAGRVLPLVGYSMIFMTLIDCAAVVFPPNFLNPEWELSTLSALSDQSWAFLIGIGFVLTGFFHGGLSQVRRIELRLIFAIRWFLLLWALLFLLALPLVLVNTNRIVGQIKTEFTRQTQASQELIGNVETNLDRVTDKNQLLQVAQTLGVPIPNADVASVGEIQATIREQLPQIKERVPKDAARGQRERFAVLFKRSARLACQLIIIIIVNTLVWFKTRRVGFLVF